MSTRRPENLGPCIPMTQKPDPKGYGRIGVKRFGKVIRRAHVLAWVDANGRLPNPETPCILHHCDNRACVNPEHLYEGTQQDNMRDAVERNRFHNANKTHCIRGHEYPSRPYQPGQKRVCQQCINAWKRENRRAIAEAEGRPLRPWGKYGTHCVNGHLFDEANTYYRKDGARGCRECGRKTSREYAVRTKVKRKEAA